MSDPKNKLYYGDNLEVLRRYIPDQSVDLVYLDPPFNSRQDYNVLFGEKDGTRSASQITAFKDTWEWNQEASRAYEEVVETGGRVAEAMRAFRTLLGGTDMLAYLSMMAPRLVELRRVLKETGSIYRAEVILDMQSRGIDQPCIDRWLQGQEHAQRRRERCHPINLKVYVSESS